MLECGINWVLRLDLWLQNQASKGNYRAHLLKTLRALYNKAIKEKEALREDYPFGLDGFNINALTEKTRKRHLSHGGIDKVLTARFENERLETTRRLFVFTYYAYGMSFVDACLLKLSDVKKINGDEFISYKRQKTSGSKNWEPIDILVTPQIREQLDWFEANCERVGDYLLPLMTVKYDDPERQYNHYTNRYRKFRESLIEIAGHLDIPSEQLTTYAARHTFANDLQLSSVPREAIQEMMGHSEITTTKTYLDELDNGVKNEYVQNSKVYRQIDDAEIIKIPKTRPVKKKKIKLDRKINKPGVVYKLHPAYCA